MGRKPKSDNITDEELYIQALSDRITSPSLGISKPAQDAIIALMKHVHLDKKVNEEVLERWRIIGRLTKDGKLQASKKFIEGDTDLELVLMGLEFEGFLTAEQKEPVEIGSPSFEVIDDASNQSGN